MSGSADYIPPGHREPIGEWSTARLESALDDYRLDLEFGYLPPSVAEAVDYLSAELARREQGGERQASAEPAGLGRALDRWFADEAAPLPTLRGETPGAAPAMADVDKVVAAEAARGVAAEPPTRPTLTLVWPAPEVEQARDHALEPDLEP
jgi:hypothetical protein